jgi:hypothetical protein
LYGDSKKDFQTSIIIKGNFDAFPLMVTVDTVSSQANLVVKSDGVIVFEKLFKPGAGQGEWKESKLVLPSNTYQAVYDRAYTAHIPAGTHELRLEVTKGDWMTLSEIRIHQLAFRPGSMNWGERQESFTLDAQGNLRADSGRLYYDKERLDVEEIEPWKPLEVMNIGVHVGEFGVYNKTPHNAALALLRDKLDLFREAGWGWALWNLRGTFGILDSDRGDVKYEIYQGHKLDRAMLELLKQG